MERTGWAASGAVAPRGRCRLGTAPAGSRGDGPAGWTWHKRGCLQLCSPAPAWLAPGSERELSTNGGPNPSAPSPLSTPSLGSANTLWNSFSSDTAEWPSFWLDGCAFSEESGTSCDHLGDWQTAPFPGTYGESPSWCQDPTFQASPAQPLPWVSCAAQTQCSYGNAIPLLPKEGSAPHTMPAESSLSGAMEGRWGGGDLKPPAQKVAHCTPHLLRTSPAPVGAGSSSQGLTSTLPAQGPGDFLVPFRGLFPWPASEGCL